MVIRIHLCAVVSVTLGGCGLVLICIWPVIFDSFMTLSPNSILYHFWKRSRVDVNADYYFFNWTNPEDFYNLSTKPKFEEVGPYSFLQKDEKLNITWNNNDTVTFKQKKIWIYQNKETNGDLTDPIVTFNPVPLTTAYIMRNWNYYAKKGVYMTLSGFFGKHYMTQNVGNLLFQGYPELLIKMASDIPMFSQYDFPKWNRFGYFYNRNNSDEFEGTFNIGTGKNTDLGYIHYWNYQNKSKFFDDACADIGGSAEQFFPRNLKKDFLKMFIPDLGGTSHLTFVKEETVNNVLGYKFVVGDKALDNGTKIPETRCLCGGECVPFGAVNTTKLRHSVPVFVSLPHFYKADPYYNNLVDGLEPNETKHEFFIIVEPTTGIPLKGHVAVQVNLLVQPVSGISMFEKAPKFFYPILWVSYSFELDSYLVFLVKLLVNLRTICIIIGLCFILIGTVVCAVIMRKRWINLLRKEIRMPYQEETVCLNTELEERKR